MNRKDRVVIAGGTGFLGQNLARDLVKTGYEVVVLSRNVPTSPYAGRHVKWDGRTLGEWGRELDGARAVVNLAGRTVDCVKTPDRCDEILRSRVESTEVLGRALIGAKSLPSVWVQMSTAHIVGDPPEVVCDEDSAFGYGLAPTVGRAWEDTFARVVPPSVRQVVLRTSFVLGRTGGALRRLGFLVRCGLGGTVGSGRQGMSWIHEDDMTRLIVESITEERLRGVYLATAPTPVSNEVFMRELRRALHIPIGLPAYEWMVRIGAPLFLRTDPELALYGRYCVSRRLREDGFEFRFPEVSAALLDLYSRDA